MSWRDFFYFSKGERSGLIVLLCLITTAGILLILNNKPEPVNDSVSKQISVGDVRESSGETSGSRSLKTQSTTAQPSSKKGVSANNPASSAKNIRKSDSDVIEQSLSSEESENISGAEVYTPADAESKSAGKKESVSERVNRLTSYSRPSYSRTEKFQEGTVVELNTADTTILKKVPGIGSAFAKRIVSYRNLLGGYYSVTQLSEVYGMDEDRYDALVPWFSADPLLIAKLSVNTLSQDSLRRHPYIDYGQARIITQLRRQKGKLTGWDNFQLLNEFTDADKKRLQYYLSFE